MPLKSSKSRVSKNIKKYVQSKIEANQETKHLNYTYNTSVTDEIRTPLDTLLVDVDQGDTANQRSGNQLFVTGIYGRFAFRQADTTNLIRVILYIPKDPSDSLTSGLVDYIGAVDLDRFTVLSDKLVNVNVAGKNQQVMTLARKFNKGIKKGITVQYTDGTGSNCTKNNLRLYMVSDSAATADPSVYGYMRIYYKDG